MSARKIVQLAVGTRMVLDNPDDLYRRQPVLFALADDGTAWLLGDPDGNLGTPETGDWEQLPALPGSDR